jgi:hypothetical protein
MKLQHIRVSEEQVKMEAKRHIEGSYTSFLSDNTIQDYRVCCHFLAQNS